MGRGLRLILYLYSILDPTLPWPSELTGRKWAGSICFEAVSQSTGCLANETRAVPDFPRFPRAGESEKADTVKW